MTLTGGLPILLRNETDAVLNLLTNLFPLWVLTGGALALWHPPLFVWFTRPMIVWGLAVIMLGMGITLSVQDFRKVLTMPRAIVVGFAALHAFDRPLPSTMAAAQDFQAGLNGVQALPPGRAFQWTYTEMDLSSYMHFILGPQIGFNASARFLSSDEVAFQGNWSGMLGLPVTVVTRMETDSPQLYHTVSAAVQILPLPNSNFGWVALPAAAVQPLVDAINQNLAEGYSAKAIDYPSFEATAGGDLAPPLDVPLRILGISD